MSQIRSTLFSALCLKEEEEECDPRARDLEKELSYCEDNRRMAPEFKT